MVRAENDQIMAPECSIKLFDAVGSPESQVCLKGMGHYSAMAGLAGIMDDLTSFFAEDLPAEWKPQVADNTLTPVVLLGGFLTDISALIAASPKKGCAHMAGVRVEFSVKGRSQKFDFNLVLGEDGCFKLSGVFPEVGSAGLGRGAFPWIIGGGKKVFCGTQSADPDLKLADMIGPDAMLRYRMAVGLAAGASLSPDLINNYAKAGIRNGGGRRILTLASLHKEAKGGAEIIFDESGRHPLKAVWDVGESKGSVEFTHWQINAASHSSLFEPDDGVERQDVLQQDVLQMFASAFQFLAEKAGEL
jgi:hypothetical protein